MNVRGVVSFLIYLGFFVGGIIATLLAMWLAPTIDKEANWRLLLIIYGLPAVIPLVAYFTVLKESFRFYAKIGKTEEAIDTLNYICRFDGIDELS
jgi:MFS family permease